MVIGITGGIGAGKSQVLSIMEEEYGAYLLKADEIAHLLSEPGHSCFERIVDAFGTGILNGGGSLDRGRLSDLVFQDEEKRRRLNAIVHPMVKEYILGEISCVNLEDPARIIVVEAALLIEDHYDQICDELWYIYASLEVRKKRLIEIRGYTEEKFASIVKSQLTEEEFRKYCQKVIDNNGTIDQTKEEIKKALEF